MTALVMPIKVEAKEIKGTTRVATITNMVASAEIVTGITTAKIMIEVGSKTILSQKINKTSVIISQSGSRKVNKKTMINDTSNKKRAAKLTKNLNQAMAPLVETMSIKATGKQTPSSSREDQSDN